MNFFVIPPLSALHLMDEGTAGYYCLAHLYIQHADYREFFKEKKKLGKYVLLDNGAAEQDLVTNEILLDIVGELKPDLVIPPDVLLNKEKTLENFFNFANEMLKRNYHKNTSIFACPQGSTREEWIDCFAVMQAHGLVTKLGLSKIAVPYCWNNIQIGEDRLIKESRWECVEDLKALDLLEKDIHCLGAGDMREFQYYRNFPEILTTDSCNTIWSAMNGIDFSENNFERIPTPHDYFDREINESQLLLAKKNIDWFKNNF